MSPETAHLPRCMRRLLAASTVLLILGSCSGDGGPPFQQSPPTFASSTFFDNFERTDTTLGLGANIQGLSYDMRGAYVDSYPLPAASDGFIRDGAYTYAGQSVVYAIQHLRGRVRRMGTVGRWRASGGDREVETSVAMATSPNDLYISDLVHFAASRYAWDLSVRNGGGPFISVASGRFVPVLRIGEVYWFELAATDQAITVVVPGAEVTQNVAVAALLGNYAFWEEYPNGPNPGSVFDFEAIWASEDGQLPLPADQLVP